MTTFLSRKVIKIIRVPYDIVGHGRLAYRVPYRVPAAHAQYAHVTPSSAMRTPRRCIHFMT